MTITKKKIGLGVLAAVSVAAIPIATTISCGSKKTNEGSGSISSDFSASMPLTWNVLNASGQAAINAVVENYGKAETLATNNNWTCVFEDSTELLSEDNTEYDDKTAKDSKRINQKMMKVINGLSDIQKRSMVIAGTDIDVSDGDATKHYKIKIYTTIDKADGSDMSDELKRFISIFLKNSNSKAKSFNDGAKLDEIEESKRKDHKLEDYAMKRYLSASRSMRNFGEDSKSVYDGQAFYDNGFFDVDKSDPEHIKSKYDDFTHEVFFGKNPLADVVEGEDKKHLDVSSVPVYDVQKGEFRQNITFYEGVKFEKQSQTSEKNKKWEMSVPGWTGSGSDLAGHTPVFKGYKKVFTMNPLIQKFGDGDRFKNDGFNSLSDEQLVDYIGMIHRIMYELGPAGIVDGLRTLTTLLPTATPFILTNQDWCRALDQIRKGTATAEEAVEKVKDLVRNNISEVRKTIKNKQTISEERLAFAYYRDHNNETLKAFGEDGAAQHWKVRKTEDVKTSKIVELFDLTALDGANVQIISMLFDYINSLYSLGNTLTDLAWDAELID
ncbi:MAG: hypothetical protein HRT98_00135 [Mycoplasmatales bacterium]|nr:hypothetical protein [Mycoplasmatales bacterium]